VGLHAFRQAGLDLTGVFGLVAFMLNAFALSALVGVEFVINLVFKDLPVDTVEALRAGSLGIALTTASITFLLGTVTFVTAMFRTRQVPTAPLVLYAAGAVPVSLRAFVPEAVLDLGLVVLAVGSPGSRSGFSTAPTASRHG
jgi:hypothetical protein